VAFTPFNPKGIASFSPGSLGTSYPGYANGNFTTRQGEWRLSSGFLLFAATACASSKKHLVEIAEPEQQQRVLGQLALDAAILRHHGRELGSVLAIAGI